MTIIRHYNPSKLAIHREIMPLLVSLICLAVLWVAPAFRYNASAADSERIWTAWAAQVAHLDARHLMFNLLGLWLVSWGLAPWRTPRLDGVLLFAGLAGVASGLLLSPQVSWYCGLSGALHGLFCGYVCHLLLTDGRTPVRRVGILLLLGLATKLVAEDPELAMKQPALLPLTDWLQWLQPPEMTNPAEAGSVAMQSGAQPVLYAAHRWGAGAGMLTGTLTGLQAVLRGKRLQKR